MRETRLQSDDAADALSSLQHILLIDSRPLVRASLIDVLQGEWPAARVHVEADVAAVLGDPARWRAASLAVFSAPVGLHGDRSARRALSDLVTALPAVPVAVLSDGDGARDVRAAVDCGARGFVSTRAELPVLRQSLRLLWVGGTLVPATVLVDAEGTKPPPERPGLEPANESRIEGAVVDIFTPKELEVLQCLKAGKPNKIIAYDLNICETTVKVHVRHIMRKLGAANRTHAAILARDLFDASGREL